MYKRGVAWPEVLYNVSAWRLNSNLKKLHAQEDPYSCMHIICSTSPQYHLLSLQKRHKPRGQTRAFENPRKTPQKQYSNLKPMASGKSDRSADSGNIVVSKARKRWHGNYTEMTNKT